LSDSIEHLRHVRDYPPARGDEAKTTRGQFLTLSTIGLGAAIGGVIGVPATAYVLAPVFDKIHFTPVMLGTVDEFPTEQGFKPTPKTFIEDAHNPNTSAALAFVHNTGKDGTNWADETTAKFIVFSNRCMHLGCPVQASGTGFACPCHGGQYNQKGIRTAGPPIRPLDRYAWQIRNSNQLWLTDRWSVDYVNGKIKYYEVKMPGQPVNIEGNDTISNILYPRVTYDPNTPIPKP
jgi:menaquinol-cytochrome c reductase iron-sulfur subunit